MEGAHSGGYRHLKEKIIGNCLIAEMSPATGRIRAAVAHHSLLEVLQLLSYLSLSTLFFNIVQTPMASW